MKNLDKDYARKKLEILLRDLGSYNADEFWREMSRIASGATGAVHAEGLKSDIDSLAGYIRLFLGVAKPLCENAEEQGGYYEVFSDSMDELTNLCFNPPRAFIEFSQVKGG
ncbi:hypothetical protein [Aliidiomarina sanyensis]|uniref:Uncharacterized protein n=1 Tax=Aliidiomarina sanyensis TaxID=1249555 RepID=A0A432WB38_9GAMM|nr:hypothetical protein [Aliidiomarina sanyensis]RUO28214.1 hypothetical protein CWE11_10925 [Aliidiomarina sanyensis]